MEIKKNGIVLDYGSRSVTIPNDINSSGAGYVLNIGDDDSSADRSFEGNIAEILIFDKDLSSEESIKVNAYLAEKWGLSIDSDGDGIKDVFDTDPTDPNKWMVMPSVLRQSTTDSYTPISELELWYDATNTDGNNNLGLNNESSIDSWIDLSEPIQVQKSQ